MTSATLPRPTETSAHTDCQSARRAGGPQDAALYECDCGKRFLALVSTSVDCPHCGSDQAW